LELVLKKYIIIALLVNVAVVMEGHHLVAWIIARFIIIDCIRIER